MTLVVYANTQERIDGDLEARVEVCRPQLEAYARTVAREPGLPEERAESALVFLRREFVVRL